MLACIRPFDCKFPGQAVDRIPRKQTQGGSYKLRVKRPSEAAVRGTNDPPCFVHTGHIRYASVETSASAHVQVGKRILYRHFVRRADGGIVEMFGPMGIMGEEDYGNVGVCGVVSCELILIIESRTNVTWQG